MQIYKGFIAVILCSFFFLTGCSNHSGRLVAGAVAVGALTTGAVLLHADRHKRYHPHGYYPRNEVYYYEERYVVVPPRWHHYNNRSRHWRDYTIPSPPPPRRHWSPRRHDYKSAPPPSRRDWSPSRRHDYRSHPPPPRHYRW